jgi:hypothetical protein
VESSTLRLGVVLSSQIAIVGIMRQVIRLVAERDGLNDMFSWPSWNERGELKQNLLMLYQAFDQYTYKNI